MKSMIVADALALGIAAFCAATAPITKPWGLWAAVLAMAIVLVAHIISYAFEDQDDRLSWRGVAPPPDPWELQRDMMASSGQQLPDRPTFTNDTLLYLALVMEETAETYRAAAGIRMGHLSGMADHFVSCLHAAALANEAASRSIRGALGSIHIHRMLTDEDAAELLDGISDVTVVSCGFSLATGLPGSEGYYEVGRSNLSKRNPDTAMIDRDPSGKWIKGRDYFAPNLRRVVREARP